MIFALVLELNNFRLRIFVQGTQVALRNQKTFKRGLQVCPFLIMNISLLAPQSHSSLIVLQLNLVQGHRLKFPLKVKDSGFGQMGRELTLFLPVTSSREIENSLLVVFPGELKSRSHCKNSIL